LPNNEAKKPEPTLAELRASQTKPALAWMRKHTPWLLNWRSLFYFGLFVAIVGFIWMGYSLLWNKGTQMYGWDYMSQYIEFYYRYWDIWRNFFKTGHFIHYDPAIYLGADSIGTMSYYGLFDPFVFLNTFFPRAWVPQMTAIFTTVKCVCSAFAMRAYLKYMGVKETTSRIGGLAYAFCGFVNFFVGFPSFVSCVPFVPLIMLGIEKVLKERKIYILMLSIGMLGVISFFFLVVMCVWGAVYALWRFFWTIKTRKAADNWKALGLGTLAFLLGLMLCSWSVLPSVRQSTLSGRGQSIGYFYLQDLLNALKTFDVKRVFARMFEMVGNHPGREMMGIVSFFFPTCNYLWLPLYGGGATTSYDSWTSSLFIFTPMIIFFAFQLIQSVRKKDWEHLVGFALCSYLVFTIFAYFFFFAFTGDGYGRWYIVLVPLLIRQACRGMDNLKDAPKWQLPVASGIVAVATLLTFFMVRWVLKDETFTNDNYMTYWNSSYNIPAYVTRNGKQYTTLWLSIYQMGLTVVESVVIYFLQHRKSLRPVVLGFVAIEACVCGNISFLYGSSYSYGRSFNGGYDKSLGWTTATQLTEAFQYVTKEYDPHSLYRAYADYPAQKNMNYAMGYNGTTPWSSLFNYAVIDLSHYSHIIENEYYSGSPYGYQNISSRWSGYYNNKRFAFDLSTGMKYYAIVSEDTGFGDLWDDDNFLYNVPFGSKCVFKNNKFRIYENPYYLPLGHAVDKAYRKGAEDITKEDGTLDTTKLNHSAFYQDKSGNSGYAEIVRNEEVYLDGAIFDDDAVVPEWVSFEEAPSTAALPYNNLTTRLKARVYQNVPGYGFHYQDPAAFLTDDSFNSYKGPYSNARAGQSFLGTNYGVNDKPDGKLVWTINAPSGNALPDYFNEDPTGAYFLMAYPSKNISRVYMIGDTFEEDGVTIKEENRVLNYEYHSFDNVNSQLSGSYGGLFGIYAPGRVRYIVFSKKNGDDGASPNPYLLMKERYEIEAQYAKLTSQEYALTDVDYKQTDYISAKTNFSESRIVVTTLGYDAGWHVTAKYTGDSGQAIEEKLQVYRLDGGFVGFIAPKGEVTYQFRYKTPYLGVGYALAGGAVVGYAMLHVGYFLYQRHQKKKHLEEPTSDA